MKRNRLTAVSLMLLTALAGTKPAFPASQPLAPGVSFTEVMLPRPKPARLWIYLPSPQPAGKLPCVVIAPSGTALFSGMKLQDGDRAEHLPYVRAGFAVIAYDIDGPIGAKDPNSVRTAIQDFRAAEAGVANARIAIGYALQRLGVDPNHLYVAGHSSAATLALQVAERDKRVRGVIAYAPVTDVPNRVGAGLLADLDKLAQGTAAFLKDYSPLTHVDMLRCPAFLFHSQLDTNVPAQQTIAFSRELSKTNPRMTLITVPSGDHYDSMIKDGIPRAIAWLRSRAIPSPRPTM